MHRWIARAAAATLNTEGNPMFASTCNGSTGQQWSTYSASTLRVQGGCLDVNAAGTSPGTAVKWYPCNGTVAQNWTHQANGELVNPNSGLWLTDPGNNPATALDIDACTAAAGQTWTLPSGSGGGNTVTVTNPATRRPPWAAQPACRFRPATRRPGRR